MCGTRVGAGGRCGGSTVVGAALLWAPGEADPDTGKASCCLGGPSQGASVGVGDGDGEGMTEGRGHCCGPLGSVPMGTLEVTPRVRGRC